MKFTPVFSGLILGFLACLIPQISRAADFQPLERGLVLEAKTAIYRLRAGDQPPQLAELPAGAIVKQMIRFNDQLVAVVQTTTQDLYVSKDGLRWRLAPPIATAAQLSLKATTGELFVWRQEGATKQLWRTTDLGQFVLTDTSAIAPTVELDRLMVVGQATLLAVQQQNDVVVFQLNGEVWQSRLAIPCPGSQIIRRPVDFLYCVTSGQVLVPTAPEQWLSLFSLPVQLPHVSDHLIVAQPVADATQILIWEIGQTAVSAITHQLAGTVGDLFVGADRVLIRYPTQGWQELLWRPSQPLFVPLAIAATALPIVTDNANRLYLSAGLVGLSSDQAGVWQPITTTGSFNHARQTTAGWLIWQTNQEQTTGGRTQFADSASGLTYLKVNRWSSTTSPVQAIWLGDSVSYVAVINSSNRWNLYKSSLLVEGSWSLVTLPTQPTFSRVLSELRGLAPNSLVEAWGTMTVPPGVVSPETAYLTDQTGGIQIFLDDSNGSLPDLSGKLQVASGTISNSQTKRIVLDDLINLENQGDGDRFSWPSVTPNQLADRLGQLVKLQGEVTAATSASFLLKNGDSLFKVHLLGTNKPLVGDTIELTVLIDWNSAAGAVEGWATETSFRVLVHPSPSPTPSPTVTATPPTPTPTATSAAQGSTAGGTQPPSPKATQATAKTIVTTNSPTKTISQPTQIVARSTSPEITPVVAGQSIGTDDGRGLPTPPFDTVHVTVMGVISFISGLLLAGGRRFRQSLWPDSS